MENAEVRNGGAANMSGASVQSTIRQLQNELEHLFRQRAATMQRIGAAKKTIVGLAALFGDTTLNDHLRELVGMGSVHRSPGLTNMCRTVLMEADRGMSAQDILEEISAQNSSLLAGHKNPLASLTTVLNRLVSYGEAQRVQVNNHRRGWRWADDAGKDSSAKLTSDPVRALGQNPENG